MSGQEEQRELSIGKRIGGYRIVKELGRGGMGVVYQALQEHPQRTVALKVVTAARSHAPDVVKRFLREAEVLGRLQHPGIAQIFEAGEFEDGGVSQSFFAMELVEGQTLKRHVEDAALGLDEKLELVAKIADAVHHAHLRGVIHRDLKPGNVLVDAAGQPKVLDFGIARVTDADLATVTLQTDVGQVIGTIPYMSPEQASGDPNALDVRSDIYSLGVVAYELVAGRMPYELDLSQVWEAVRVVREEEAEPLSRIDTRLRGDVETILGKALEKDPERRYASAAAFADDLRRFLTHEPISARPPSRMYRMRKFVRRNTALVVGTVGIVTALIVGLIGTSLGYVEARRERVLANDAKEAALASAERAQRTSSFLSTILSGISPSFAQGEDTTLLVRILDDTEARLEEELDGLPLAEAEIRQALALAHMAIGNASRAEPHLSRSLTLFENEAGEFAEATLRARARFGSVANTLGRPAEAEEHLRAASQAAHEHLGPRALATLRIDKALGILLHAQNEFSEALELSTDILERMEDNPEVNAELYLDTCIPHSTYLLELDRHAEAEPFLDRLVERTTRELGKTHPFTIQALFNRSALDLKLAPNAESIGRHRDLCERTRIVYGPDHAITRETSRIYSQLLRDAGRWSEAEEVLDSVLASAHRKLGPDNPFTLNTQRALGQVWARLGRSEDAMVLFEEASEGLAEALGDDHPDVLDARRLQAELLGQLRRHEEAIELFEEIMPALERREGTRSSRILARGKYALSLSAVGRKEEAEALLREVLADRLALEGPDHPATLIERTGLGLMLASRGRTDEAVEQLALSLDGHVRSLGPRHPETGKVHYNVGAVLHEAKRTDEALPHLAAAAAILHETGGPDHPSTRDMTQRLNQALYERGVADLGLSADAADAFAANLASLAHVLLEHERGQQALPLTEAALELRMDLDPLDPRMAWTQTLYGMALMQDGSIDDGQALIEAARGQLSPEDAAKL